MIKPTLRECIEGSYKEGFELEWKLQGGVVILNSSSINPPWCYAREGIEANIYRDLAKYFPELTLRWI